MVDGDVEGDGDGEVREMRREGDISEGRWRQRRRTEFGAALIFRLSFIFQIMFHGLFLVRCTITKWQRLHRSAISIGGL